MSSKIKSRFICNECGHEHPKWNGRCSGCGAWNTLEETVVSLPSTSVRSRASIIKAKRMEEITGESELRLDTGCGELNRVLGGGLVKGSLVLLSGEPGIGKSTLLLQICGFLGKDFDVLYISGEESESQLKMRAMRLGIQSDRLLIASGTDCSAVLETAKEQRPDVLIVDSIQTMRMGDLASSPGSVTQVRECTNLFMEYAKSEGVPVFIVGHVNKDGGIAGPKVLEHIVDTVLYFEGERQLSYRILRAEKNRFGSTNEIGVFEMGDMGLSEVPNPSALLLSGRPAGVSGISILCTMEGSRPILAEVQSLVTKTGFPSPKRVANGFDYNRLYMLIAVLEKRTQFLFSAFDVYVNIIGGLKIQEPAADLAVAAALYSGLCDRIIPEGTVLFGEVGLGGEIRSVSHIRERVREAKRMGFDTCIIPKACLKNLLKTDAEGIRIIGVANLKQAFTALEKSNPVVT